MIEVKNLSFTYKNNFDDENKEVIKDLSFNINDNSWVSIIGHNGCGKTTLSKLLVGLLSPSSGTVSFDGVILDKKTENEIRKNVGIIFQNPDNQFIGTNVKYDIAFGLENRCIPRDEMLKLIDSSSAFVGMRDHLDKQCEELSGGQKQRVCIAGIIAINSKYIILDEALSMIDPKSYNEIIILLKELKEKHNKTIISITHDIDSIKISDQVIVLKEGKKIFDGIPSDLFKERKLLKESNLDLPLCLRLINMLEEDSEKYRGVINKLWEYHSKM